MAIDSVSATAAPQVTGAIRQAAQSTGTSFEYLLTTARIESNLNPLAQASTSSAKGLYQFIEQTWLATLKEAGPSSGYGQFADAISRTADGRYQVADPTARTAIMKLRSDPAASAMMAGRFTRSNAEQLGAAIGRAPSEGELYIAHFLGPDGAARLIGAATTRPGASAAAMFPEAAAANRSIFYDGAGRARDAGAVYANLVGRFDIARALSFPSVLRGAVPPDTAGVTQAFADAKDPIVPPVQPPPPQPAGAPPLFQSMFSDRGGNAVTPAVSSLWTPAKSGPTTNQTPRPLDLFTDSVADPRKLFGAI